VVKSWSFRLIFWIAIFSLAAPLCVRAEELACSPSDAEAIARRRKRGKETDALPHDLKSLSEAQKRIDELAAERLNRLFDNAVADKKRNELDRDLARLQGLAAEKHAGAEDGFREGASAIYTDGKYRGPNQQPRLGVFGGDFDPPGEAQRQAILKALASGKLDEIYVVTHGAGGTLPHRTRAKMAELAFSGNPRVKFLDLDKQTQTYPKIVESLAAKNRNGVVVSISGSEALRDPLFGRLRGNNVQYLVVGKPEDGAMVNDALKAKFGSRMDLVKRIDGPDISEAAAFKHGMDPAHGLPDAVAKYVEQYNLYAVEERAPASVTKGKIKAPLDPALGADFAKLKNEPRIEQGIGASAAQFHVLNADATFKEFARRGKSEFELEETVDTGVSLQEYCHKEMGVCFMATGPVKQDGYGQIVSLKDVRGRWFTVKGEPGPNPKHMVLDFSHPVFDPPYHVDLTADVRRLREFKQSTRLEEMSAEELGNFLAERQLVRSSNDAAAAGAAKEAFEGGIRDANTMLADLLVNKKEFTSDTLDRMNWYANRGIDPYEEKKFANLAGVERGTNDRVVMVNGEFVRQDMTRFQVYQGGDNTFGLVKNHFLPASQVPAKVDELVARINKLGHTSDPTEAFAIFKDAVETHPFADANGRTSRMLLNYMLLKTGLPPLDVASQSLYYSPNDMLRKYVARMDRVYGSTAASSVAKYDFNSMRSFNGVKDMDDLTSAAKEHFKLDKLTIEHLHGTSGFIFVGHYKERPIQFESTRFGEQLSDSLGIMVSRSEKIIDDQEEAARVAGKRPPSYAIYPELLEQKENYHALYEDEYFKKTFTQQNKRPPSEAELYKIRSQATDRTNQLLKEADRATSDREYFEKVMYTPKVADRVSTPEEVAEKVLSITSAEYKDKIYKAITEKASPGVRQSFVDIYNAFNSPKFDSFMADLSERALGLCRKAAECTATQRNGIPDKFLAQVLKQEADKRGILLETLSRYVGREPGHLYLQRIRRGSLLIDDGAPGNHGMMPHGIQNLFIYEQLGKEKAQTFFKELTGWTYERMFDSNAAFTPVPSTRDITRRQYWTGVFTAGNRAEVSRYGELVGEAGRYPGFLRDNGLELVAVEEIEKNLLNDGSVIKARYKDKEFSFTTNRDGVPNADAAAALEAVKREVDGAPRAVTAKGQTPPDAVVRGVPVYGYQALARLELQNPAAAAEARFLESASNELAAARRSYFSGQISLKDLDRANDTYGYLASPVTGTDPAIRRLGYLRQEEGYLARLIEKARADKDPALAGRLSAAHAAVDAQLAGESRARSAVKSNRASRRAQIEAANSDAVFARYQADFPGRTLSEVTANPAEAELYSALRSRDAIQEMHTVSDARTDVASALFAGAAKGDQERSLNLADSFIEVSGTLTSNEKHRPTELGKKLRMKGWTEEETGALDGSSLANPWLNSPAEPQKALLSAATRGVILEDEAKRAADARDLLAVPSLGAKSEDAYKAAKTDLAARAKAIESDIDTFSKNATENPIYRQSVAEAKHARDLIEERITKLDENRAALMDARAPTKSEEKLAQDATEAAVHFLQTASPETLSSLKLDGAAIHPDASGAERFRIYDAFKTKVAAMPAEDRAQVFEAVRASATNGNSDLARNLSKAKPLAPDTLKSALTKANEVATATGHPDAANAVFREAKIGAGDQAIANAIGSGSASAKSGFERHAMAVAESKKVEAENEKLVSNAERAEALKTGRTPSSLAKETFQEKAERALGGISALSADQRAALTKALGQVAAAERSDKNAKAALEHMKALSANPDMFDTYRIAYVHAAEALAADKTWDKAWETGVKKMLLESDYKEAEVMKIVDKESDLRFYQQTARCLRL